MLLSLFELDDFSVNCRVSPCSFLDGSMVHSFLLNTVVLSYPVCYIFVAFDACVSWTTTLHSQEPVSCCLCS